MRYINPLFPFVLLLSLFACSIGFAFDPYSSTDDAYSFRTDPYNQRFNPYPDGSSRPLNPGAGGRWSDDEYNSRPHSKPSSPYGSPSDPPPAFSGPRDRTIMGPDGMRLCTTSPSGRDTYCF